MSEEFSISVRNLGKRYSKSTQSSIWPFAHPKTDDNVFWALKEINFDIRMGEGIGIIGPNGAGKSTLLKILGRIISPTTGEAKLYGRVNSLLEVGTGFQPDLTGRANIYLNASILGLAKHEVDEQFDEIVEFSGVGDFIDMPVRHYSSGMYSRLAFAVAAHITGDILLVDEVLSVGDAEFRRKSLTRMNDLMQAEHRTVLFVSHSMDAILRFCDRVLWIDKGRLLAFGPADDIVRDYLNEANRLVNTRSKPSVPGLVSVGTPNQSDQEDSKGGAVVEHPHAKNGSEAVDSALVAVGEDFGYSETDAARIARVALLDASYSIQLAFFRDETIRVDLDFEVHKQELLSCFIAIRCAPRKGIAQETLVFSDYSNSLMRSPGCYKTSVTLPSRLFASGTYFLTVGLVTIGSPIIKHHLIKRILAFQVADRDEQGDVMGEYVRGVIRPTLTWDLG